MLDEIGGHQAPSRYGRPSETEAEQGLCTDRAFPDERNLMRPSIATVPSCILVCFVGGGGILPGCGPSELERSSPDGPPGVLQCGFRRADGAQGDDVLVYDETYRIDKINEKLRNYPELAATIHMVNVSTCNEARQFMHGYLEYYSQHAHFDDMAFDVSSAEEISAPPGPPAEIDKIANGIVASSYPVVQLSSFHPPDPPRWPNGYWEYCSGYFITKNWVVTAAHCLVDPQLWQKTNAGTNGKAPTGQWGKFKIGRANTSTNAFEQTISEKGSVELYGYEVGVPGYLGTGDWVHDTGLVYFYGPYYDTVLPSPSNGNGAMRISMEPPEQGQLVEAWGWGPPKNPPELTTNVAPIHISNVSLFGGYFDYAPTLPSEAALCHGDSGGPVARLIDTQFGSYLAAKGTYMGWSDPKHLIDNTPCGELPASTYHWRRIDELLPWIEGHIRNQLGTSHFKCQEFPDLTRYNDPMHLAGSTYVRCWGNECHSQQECNSDEICKGLGWNGTPPYDGQCIKVTETPQL